MKRIVTGTAALVLLAAFTLGTGCGGGGGTTTGKGPKTANGVTVGEQPGGVAVNKEAADAFSTAVADFKKHEEARDWDDGSCTSVSGEFLSAGKAQGGKFPAAHYNAGIVLLRCGRETDAGAEFETALTEAADLANGSSDPKMKADPVFHQVWVQKALIKYRTGSPAAISEAIEMIESKGFDPDGSRNVEAFVNLGMLYRERWVKDPTNPARTKKDKFNLEDDLARAQFWLQNALSINDSFMPAYNQLALYYLDKARAVGEKRMAEKKKLGIIKPKTEAEKIAAAKEAKMKADLQTLELGLLVSEEASRRDPNYAGIWNTQGLLLLEMNRTGAATQAFKRATEKDAKFFEAWMNYAAINLAFRGYEEATKGYTSASAIRPKDYDAKLGLAVGTRGQLDFHLTTKQAMERKLSECQDPDKSGSPACQEASSKFPGQIKEHAAQFLSFYKAAIAAYEAAKGLDANRPEAFFDQAMLVEKYKAKAGEATTAQAYREAQKLYDELASKFSGNPKYAKLAEDAKNRGIEAGKSADFEEKSAAAAAAPPPPPPTTSSAKASASAAPATSASAKKP
jgi:tetratricopeptide (TPR) repeat protein